SRRKPVSFVNVQGAWTQVSADARFVKLLARDGQSAAESLRIEETELHRPSQGVLDKIRNDFKLRTENSRRTYILGIVAAVLFALTLTAGAMALIAREQRIEAERQRNEALTIQSRFLADLARQQAESGDATAGVLLALAASQD